MADGEHRGNVLRRLESAVERPAGDRLEGDIGIAVVDPLAALIRSRGIVSWVFLPGIIHMFRLRRIERLTRLEDGEGSSVTLAETVWWGGVAGRRMLLGFTYRNPGYVDRGGHRIPITDHLMAMRIAALILVVAAVVTRRRFMS